MILTSSQCKNFTDQAFGAFVLLWCLCCGRTSSIYPPGTSSSIRLVSLGATSRRDGLLGTSATAIKRQTAAPMVPALFAPWAQRCPPEVVLKFSFSSRCGENFKFTAASSGHWNPGYPDYTMLHAFRQRNRCRTRPIKSPIIGCSLVKWTVLIGFDRSAVMQPMKYCG